MKIIKSPLAFQKYCQSLRQKGKIGFVPTMGALHEGHLSLVQESQKKCDFTVVSIFVNPTQFGPSEDYKKYPRPLKHDLEKCKAMHVDAVLVPSSENMYVSPFTISVQESSLSQSFCGHRRPGHFNGVGTIVLKLLLITQPHTIFMGQKDYQQCLIIKRIIQNLNIPVSLIIVKTMREKSGLAMSSRNQYLLVHERQEATKIYAALQKIKTLYRGGKTRIRTLEKMLHKDLNKISGFKLDYAGIVDKDSLLEVREHSKTLSHRGYVALVAGFFKKTRLIDNILL